MSRASELWQKEQGGWLIGTWNRHCRHGPALGINCCRPCFVKEFRKEGPRGPQFRKIQVFSLPCLFPIPITEQRLSFCKPFICSCLLLASPEHSCADSWCGLSFPLIRREDKAWMWAAQENNYITKDSLSSLAIRCSFVVLSCPAQHGFLLACLLACFWFVFLNFVYIL